MDLRRNLIISRLTFFIGQKDPIVAEKIRLIKDKLVQCLIDGTVYSIVESLKDLQRLQEENMYKERETKLSLIPKNSLEYEKKADELDRQIIEKIDNIVSEQQSTLYCSGLSAFKVTNDIIDIKVQMEIINFILSLSDIYSDNLY